MNRLIALLCFAVPALAQPTISAVSIAANSPWSVKATWTTNVTADSAVYCGPSSPYNQHASNTVNPYATTADGSTWGVTSHSMASNPNVATGDSCYVKSCNSGGCSDTSASPVGPITLPAAPASSPIAMLNSKVVRSRLGDRYAGMNGAPQTGAWDSSDTGWGCWAADGNSYFETTGWGLAGPTVPLLGGNWYPLGVSYVRFTDTALTNGTRVAAGWNNGINNSGLNSFNNGWFNGSCISVNGVLYVNSTAQSGSPTYPLLAKSADFFQTTLHPNHNAGPATQNITAMSCSSGTVTATSKLNITDETSIISAPGSIAIAIENATGTNVNGGPWAVTGATGGTISFSIGANCTGWSWTSGGTIGVYGWDISGSATSNQPNGFVSWVMGDAADYANATPWAGSDAFAYFSNGANNLYRIRIEDLPLQSMTKAQCFSGAQTDAAGLNNSNWGGSCTATNASQLYLQSHGRGGGAPQVLYLTALHRYVLAYQLPGTIVDSNSAGIQIYDAGSTPWSQIAPIGFVPRTPDPYIWSGPEFPQWIASSQSAAGGVVSVNLSDNGGNFGININNPTTNGYDFYTTRGLQFAAKGTAATPAPVNIYPGEIPSGMDLGYNFDQGSVGARALRNAAPGDAAQKYAYVPNGISTPSITNPLFIDQYGLWMFSEASTSSANSTFPTMNVPSTQSLTTPYASALSGPFTVVNCFGHYPAALLSTPSAGAVVLQKGSDIKITYASGVLWDVNVLGADMGTVPVPDNSSGCIYVRRDSQNRVNVYTSAGIGGRIDQIVAASTAIVPGAWSSSAVTIGDSTNSFWGIEELLRVWRRDLSDQELAAENAAITKALWSRGPGAAIPIYNPVTLPTPTFSPGAGTYSGAQTVTISVSGAPAGTTICYNTTGSPTGSNGTCTGGSSAYSSPVMVSASETLYAIATYHGDINSAAGSAAYTITIAGISLVNHTWGGAQTNPVAPSSGTVNMAGANLFVACVSGPGASSAVTGIKDSVDTTGSTWSLLGCSSQISSSQSCLWYSPNRSGSFGSMTFTALESGIYSGLAVQGFSGAATSPYDSTMGVKSNTSAATSLNVYGVSPSANEAVVACLGLDANSTSAIGNTTTGFSVTDTSTAVGWYGVGAAYDVVSSGNSFYVTWISSLSEHLAGVVAAFHH